MKDKMGKSSISMFTREGQYLGKWGPSDEQGFALGAHTLYIEKDGMFWTTDRDGHTVKKYTPEGELLLTLGTFGEWGNDESHFNGPTAVLVQENGNIVVADGYWNSRLVWYTAEGEFIKSVGGWGRGPAQFNTPHAMAQDSKGRILVADLCGGNFHDYMTKPGQIEAHRTQADKDCVHRIQRLTPDGEYIDEWTHITPLSLATYGDRGLRQRQNERSDDPSRRHWRGARPGRENRNLYPSTCHGSARGLVHCFGLPRTCRRTKGPKGPEP